MNVYPLAQNISLQVIPDVMGMVPNELEQLIEACPKSRERTKLYGRQTDHCRFDRFYGPQAPSFTQQEPEPLDTVPVTVKHCLNFAAENFSGFQYNSVQVTWLMHGFDFVAPHADTELDVDSSTPILCFAFGADRTLDVRNYRCQFPYVDEIRVPFCHLSCVVMSTKFQEQFRHAVPLSPTTKRPTVLVTLRALLAIQTQAEEENTSPKKLKV